MSCLCCIPISLVLWYLTCYCWAQQSFSLHWC